MGYIFLKMYMRDALYFLTFIIYSLLPPPLAPIPLISPLSECLLYLLRSPHRTSRSPWHFLTFSLPCPLIPHLLPLSSLFSSYLCSFSFVTKVNDTKSFVDVCRIGSRSRELALLLWIIVVGTFMRLCLNNNV